MTKDAVVAVSAIVTVAALSLAFAFRGKLRKRRVCNGRGGARDVHGLVRRNIRELKPYRCARDDYSEGVLLDANENCLGPTLPEGGETLDVTPLALNRYPDPYQLDVKTLVASLRKVQPEQVFVGVGSDEAIDLLFRIFCEPSRDSVLICPPTYGMYSVSAKVNDVRVVTAPLSPTFCVDLPGLFGAIASEELKPKMVFLCSPGNPTAKLIPNSVVRQIFASGYEGIVVVDEAYYDFAGEGTESACSMIAEFDRLVVLQTLSKAWGMAAIRMGMAFASAPIIQYMNNVKAPYNVNRLSQEVACRALQRPDLLKQRVEAILLEREKLRAAMAALPFVIRVMESDANFFLVEIPGAQEIYRTMAERGVVVRYRGNEMHCKDCLRVTVGTDEENEKLLALLTEVVAERAKAAAPQ